MTADTDQANAQGLQPLQRTRGKGIPLQDGEGPSNFFQFLGGYAHCLRLEVKYFGKFAKFTETFANNMPLSNCTKFCQCMQGHLNFHLSSTSLTINGINNLDATEILLNTVNSSAIAKVKLREMLYLLKIENGSPLFLQLTQRPSGEVDAVIPNTPEVELKVEKSTNR
jgi:hypothetical protein